MLFGLNGPHNYERILRRCFRMGCVCALFPFLFWVPSCKYRTATKPDPVPVGWVDWDNPNRVDGLGRTCALASDFNMVSIVGGELKIATDGETDPRAKPDRSSSLPFLFQPSGASLARRRVLRTDKGWIVGFDGGEFGGSLWFVSPDGQRSTRLLGVDILKIFEALGHIFVFTSDAAEASDTGSIYELGTDGKIERTIRLFGRPNAMFQDATDSFLVVGEQGVYRVNSDLKMEIVLKRNLEGFFPNSIAVARDGTIYIGLRFFLLRLIPTEKSLDQHWLVRTQCKYFHVAEERSKCVCDGS